MEEDDLDELTIAEQVEILIEDLPAPIQKFLRSKKRDEISLQLSKKYGLHVDEAGVFERCYIYMLLGVYTPDEFVEELRKGGLAEEIIKGIAGDVNDLVFKKLREEERVGSVTPSSTYRTQSPPASVPVMEIGNPVTTPSGNNIPQQIPASEAPQYNPSFIQFSPQATNAPNATAAPTYLPHSRTMAEDMELASHGLMGQPVTPARSFQTASVPVTYAQPAVTSAPGASPVSSFVAPSAQSAPSFAVQQSAYPNLPSPRRAPPALAPVRLTPVDRFYDNTPIAKEYGNDPYREAIE